MFYQVATQVSASCSSRKAAFLVTFFAWDQGKALKRQLWSTAKKVAPAQGWGAPIDLHEKKKAPTGISENKP